jgi:SAM-dependent methyltransferase
MSSTRSWGDFYAGDVTLEAFFATLHHHAPFMEAVLDGAPASALEAGCGTAVMSSFLSMAGVETTAVDNDPAVLAVARRGANRWAGQPDFLEHDIFALSGLDRSWDVVFSQGVLEHFADDAIRTLCIESLKVAPRFVFSVPSAHYGHRDFGNERLMTADQWRSILDGIGDVDVQPYFWARRRHTYLLRRPIMLYVVVKCLAVNER